MESSESLEARGLAGLRGDIARRFKPSTYVSDWRDGLHTKVLAATGFLFFACLAPCIAFGGLMSTLTHDQIGVMEMLVATSVGGILYALFAGQPLTILGGTGPMLVFTGLLFDICQRLGLAFLPTYAWVGLWTAAFVVLAALTGMSRLIRSFTRFVDETFAALISLIFISEAIRNVARTFPADQVPDDAALLGLVLAAGTFMLARMLTRLRQRPYLRRTVRELLADFGPILAIAAMVGSRQLLPRVDLPALDVPTSLSTTSGRPWLVSLGDVPAWVPWAAAGPALLATVLVFLDQNVTVRLVNSPQNGLAKGASFHLDLLVCGLLLAACSLFGLPWLVAATVRSISHVRALSTTDGEGKTTGLENRVSPFFIHVLIGLSVLVARNWLREIPMSILYGLFLYMGVTSMSGNQFFERLRLWITDPGLYPDVHYVRRVDNRVIHIFTAVQGASLALLWIVKTSALGILFPVFIAALVPIRKLLGRFISADDLHALDNEASPKELEEDYGGP